MNMFSHFGTALVIGLTVFVSSCNKEDETVDASLVDTLESAVASLSGVIDDENGGSFAAREKTRMDHFVQSFSAGLLPSAIASICGRVISSNCSSGVKTVNYSGCSIAGSVYSLTGGVTLTYSDASECQNGAVGSLSSGESVTRTYDYIISGPRGGSLEVSSEARSNYQGTSITGGGQLTKTVSGWDVSVLGYHKILSNALGRTLFDHSVKSTSPVNVLSLIHI